MDDQEDKRFEKSRERVSSAQEALLKAVPGLLNECAMAIREFDSLMVDYKKTRTEELRLRYEREDTSKFDDKEWVKEYDELFGVLTEALSSFFHFMRSNPEDIVLLPAGRELVAVVTLKSLSSVSQGSIH